MSREIKKAELQYLRIVERLIAEPAEGRDQAFLEHAKMRVRLSTMGLVAYVMSPSRVT